MANQQTRSFRKAGISMKAQKGQSDPNNAHSGYAVPQPFEIAKGRNVDSHKEREKAGKKMWKGAGDPLNRKNKGS